MNLGRYEIQTYNVVVNGSTVERQLITYYANNGIDFFVERYYGEVRDGYIGQTFRFTNLTYDCLRTHIIGQSIVINDSFGTPLVYLTISSIQSIQRDGDIRLVVTDSQVEPVNLEFISPFDSNQAYSMLNQLLQNPDINLNDVTVDILPPQIFFNESFYGSGIVIPGSLDPGPFSTDDSSFFSVTINRLNFQGPFPLSATHIVTGLVYDVLDNRDDNLTVAEGNITIYKDVADVSNIVNSINGPGYYIVKLTAVDLSGNENTATISYIIF